MKKISTGQDSTLGVWHDLVELNFGPGAALDFLAKKISESPNGRNEEVIADESQLISALAEMQGIVDSCGCNCDHCHGGCEEDDSEE